MAQNSAQQEIDISEQVVNCQIQRCGEKSERCNPNQEFQEQLSCGINLYKQYKPKMQSLEEDDQYFLKQFKNIKCLSECEQSYKLTPSYQLLYNDDDSQMNIIKEFNTIIEDQKHHDINDKINSCILKKMDSDNFWLDAQQGIVKLMQENENILQKNINQTDDKVTIQFSKFMWTLFKKNYVDGLQKCAYQVLQTKKFDQKFAQLGSCNYKCQLFQYEKKDLKQYIVEQAKQELKTIEKVLLKQGLTDIKLEVK